jgi:hypothetical protein
MKNLKTAALALLAATALAAPGVTWGATDGTLGATSTGTFNASINIPSSNVSQVQVLGLDDFVFGTAANTQTTNVTPIEQYFCVNRSDSGDVYLSLEQQGGTNTFATLAGQSGSSGGNITVAINLKGPSGASLGGFILNSNQRIVAPQSGAGCTTSSGSSVAHLLILAPKTVPILGPAILYSGNFSSTFTLIASVQ